MKIDVDMVDRLLLELRTREETKKGFQPEAALGCFRSLGSLYDYWCKKYCRSYENTCIRYLRHFEVER